MENINKIIVNSNFNLKILNQKLKEYSELKGLFIYFSKIKTKSPNEDKKGDKKITQEIIEKSVKKINNIDKGENSEERSEKSQSYSMVEESLIKEEDKAGLESGFLDVFVKPKLIEKEDELIEGKEYEIKVRKYFKIYLDYCTNQDLQIETNPSSSFNFLYNALPNYVRMCKSIPSNNIVEFDVLVKGITKSSIINLINNLKSCVITYYGIENLEEDKYYDIIGEVAKNIINQSVEKTKQVRKYIDIICIDKKLRKKFDKNNIIFTENYKKLNLGAVNDKIIMLFTDGSYLKLKYACNKIIQEKENLPNFSFNEKIFDNRDQKNIKKFSFLLSLIQGNNIPYIIFYIGNDLDTNIDSVLINYIKHKEDKNNFMKKLIDNEKKFQDNIIKSYYINTITELIKEINLNIFSKIILLLPPRVNLKQNFSKPLFNNLVDIKLSKQVKVFYIFLTKDVISTKTRKEYGFLLSKNLKYVNYEQKFVEIKNIGINKTLLDVEGLKQGNNIINFIICDEIKQTDIPFDFIEKNNIKDIYNLNGIEFEITAINNKIRQKYFVVVQDKIINYTLHNFNVYFNNTEYLRPKNIAEKIIFDLKNMNLIFYPKKNANKDIIKEGSFLCEEYIYNKIIDTLKDQLSNALLKKIDEIKLKPILEKLSFQEEKIYSLYEHYTCIKLYNCFFKDTLMENLENALQ